MAELLSDAVAALTANEIPVAYVRFRGETPAPPYAELYLNDTQHHYSDDRNSRTLANYEIILHCADRDLRLEGLIEDALEAADITWTKRGGYRADVDLITTTYEINVYER